MYYLSFLFSFPQRSPPVFNNRESLLHPGNLAVGNYPADSQIKIVLESKKTLKRPKNTTRRIFLGEKTLHKTRPANKKKFLSKEDGEIHKNERNLLER